jgi:hypothetical protein
MNYKLYLCLVYFVKIRKYLIWFFKSFDWIVKKFESIIGIFLFVVPFLALIWYCYWLYMGMAV